MLNGSRAGNMPDDLAHSNQTTSIDFLSVPAIGERWKPFPPPVVMGAR